MHHGEAGERRMTEQRLKKLRGGRQVGTNFVPRIFCLEDRSVPSTFYVDPALSGSTTGDIVTFNKGYPGSVPNLIFAADAAAWDTFSAADKERTAFSSFNAALTVANDKNIGGDTIRIAASATPIPVEHSRAATDLAPGVLPITERLTIQGSGQGATVLNPTSDTLFDDGKGGGPVPDSLTAVFRAAGADLTVQDLTFDGFGHNIG